jgi:hypothetical protein
VNTPSLEHLPTGPILVVADNHAIAQGGPRWAIFFQATNRHYRVRLAGPSTIEAIQAEAKSLGAVAIIWAGDAETHALAQAAATKIALPFFNEEIVSHEQLD